LFNIIFIEQGILKSSNLISIKIGRLILKGLLLSDLEGLTKPSREKIKKEGIGIFYKN